MSSGFSGGGAPDIYAAAGEIRLRSSGPQQQLSRARQQQQLQGIFLDPPATQIGQQPLPPPLNLIGKRSLSDFQQSQALNSLLLLRSVRPRPYLPRSPLELSTAQRLAVNQQVRFQASNLFSNRGISISPTNPETKMMNRLQELEKALLDDDDDGDAASVVTNVNSEWSETIQSLISPANNPIASSSSSPSSSASVVTNVNSEWSETIQSLISPANNPIASSSSSPSSSASVVTNVNSEWSETIQSLISPANNPIASSSASVVTNVNSEWSETIQSLISPANNPIASSSSSPSSSSSSSVSVPSPAITVSKQSLLEAAAAIYDGRSDLAAEILARLSSASNAHGNSEQRLLDYVYSALRARVFPAEFSSPATELFSKDHVRSTQLLYDVSPCFKLGFMAANLAILEAAAEQPIAEKLHVIDFDIGIGGQYHNLLHALSNQQGGRPSALRITAVCDGAGGEERLRPVGEVLRQVASKVGLDLEFAVVAKRTCDITRESLLCSPDEALAVNFAFNLYRIPDESVCIDNPRDELLRRAKSLEPRIVTLVEQEMNANTAPFVTRVNEAFGHYGALLESMESSVPRESSDRVMVEEGLGRRVVNTLACEARDRVERCELFGKWRARMAMAGFVSRPMSGPVVESLRSRLSSGGRVNPGFTVKEEAGGVGFGWLGRTLTVASAWR